MSDLIGGGALPVQPVPTSSLMVTFAVPPKDICDLMITFVEGGGAYWCDLFEVFKVGPDSERTKVSYQEPASYEGEWVIEVTEDEQSDPEHGRLYEITPVKLATAFAALPDRLGQLLREEWDAETADVVVQQAAFGEIVYG